MRLSESQVQLLDPVNTLKRGFSITYHNGKPVRDILDIEPGDTLTSQLFRGKVISIIKTKEAQYWRKK
jgi:exodeoxyribonuclease VII large subunit